jgi:hypothetical protein
MNFKMYPEAWNILSMIGALLKQRNYLVKKTTMLFTPGARNTGKTCLIPKPVLYAPSKTVGGLLLLNPGR